MVRTSSVSLCESRVSPGTFGHGGAYGTQAWIDPINQRVYVLIIQRSNLPNADASGVRQAFQEASSRPRQ